MAPFTARSCLRKSTTERALRGLIDEAKAMVGSEWASFFLLDGEQLCSTINSTGEQLRIPANTGIAGHVAATGEPVIVPDACSDPRFNASVDRFTGMRTRNVLCAPLRAPGTDTVVGVLQLVNKSGTAAGASVDPAKNAHSPDVARDNEEGFTGDDLQVLQAYASRASDALGDAARRSASVRESVDRCLEAWENDSLRLAEVTGGRPLSHLGEAAFERLGLLERFRVDREKLALFLRALEAGYASSEDAAVRYHNSAHAASVVAFAYALLQHGGVAESLRAAAEGDGQLEVLALILAASVHDYEHRGLSNPFLVKTGDERALLYSDSHVNENHHVAAALALLQRPELDFLEHLSVAERDRLHSLVLVLVLATDMAEGARILRELDKALEPSHGAAPRLDERSLSLACQVALKCADLGHLALPWEAHLEWLSRLEAEFFRQGDLERELGFEEISFCMDRSKPGVSQTQLGFFEFCVNPLFGALLRAFPGAAPMQQAVARNYERWKALEQERAKS